ncbi:MAG: DNA alkylation repair protein [Bacteroidota bacterium]
MKQTIADTLLALQDLADVKRKKYAEESYPTKMDVIGVTTPNLRLVLKEFRRQTQTYSKNEIYSLLRELIEMNILELQLLAFEYFKTDNELTKTVSFSQMDALGKNLDNWLSVDTFATMVVGKALLAEVIALDNLFTYSKSKDPWQRRVVLVATTCLNNKNNLSQNDIDTTKKLFKLYVDDHQGMIVKALSWALREFIKTDEEMVQQFISDYESKLHKSVLREVKSKLIFGVKN